MVCEGLLPSLRVPRSPLSAATGSSPAISLEIHLLRPGEDAVSLLSEFVDSVGTVARESRKELAICTFHH